MKYAYCRISTPKQNIERQIGNILHEFPKARVYQEVYTGTTTERPEWQKLLRKVKAGDTIIFDEVSRMSRDADEGFKIYQELFQNGVELVFLKQRHIDTSVFRKALESQIEGTGNEIADTMIEAVNKVLQIIQYQQIEKAFEQAEAEVESLHRRTSEGVRRAQAAGKIVGRQQGAQIETKKAKGAKEIILKHSKTFGGSLSDDDCRKLCGVSRNSFYAYKRQLQTSRLGG